ncbi:MAG TPA: NUDIX hydrolase [Enteractinococcus helveticum]|uniref:NUDIX hydrolase n=1 Tax=Enteractinococcus helveticum TaxID=1837282 RepID=A0A921K7V6_9MICC|nr:NUDIX hydrolase [Enteractinococcus helveticum]HJF14843.1 NUDIX hydrolase [Enteractinococcus helveticum]
MRQQHIHDTDRVVAVQHQATVFQGAIWDIQRDTFTMTDTDQPLTREYITHPGAVAIVAVDDQQRIAMINQYRHPVGQDCWEIPAGLLDVEGESHLVTAQRELAEEADLQAADWSVLVDHYPSAGSSAEAIRIFLAQGIEELPTDQHHQREAEEAHLILRWIPFDQALHAVLTGAIRNVNAISGILAAHLVLNGQHQARPAEAPF